MHLPGLVGSGPLWLRGCHRVDAVHESGEWLALDGEQGVGKLAILRAVHYRRNPAGRFHVTDAAEANGAQWLADVRQELLDADGSLVIRHVDRLDARRLQVLTGALQEARAAARHRSLWVAVTLGQVPESAELADLLRLFPSTVELPPLRHHVEDLHELVPHFLAKLSSEGRLACSPEAMQLLLRTRWPGNAEQLWQVLRRVVQHRRTGSIHPDDLPPECRTVSNKVKAAESLGMSRATIYRKIHEYGIVTPTASIGRRR
jgi:transcriptional regulator of acetoin/glycerol metabolism